MKTDYNKSTGSEIFGYITFMLSVITIADVLTKYLFFMRTPSKSIEFAIVELFFIIFLMAITIILFLQEKSNTNHLVKVSYIYAFISTFIYIFTAYIYILGDSQIKNFSLMILLLFIILYITTIMIFKKIEDSKHLFTYAFLLFIGLIFVLGILFVKIVITNDDNIRFSTIFIYLIGGVGFIFPLIFFGTDSSSEEPNIEKITKVEDERIDDDARW